MNQLLYNIANNKSKESWASKMRQSRFELFLNLLKSVSKPINILDVGGTQVFWEMRGFTGSEQIKITLLNLKQPKVTHPNFVGLVGDATNLVNFSRNQFDVVFSNSVIEHVGDITQAERMASEIMRVGRRYFVQTPNYYFPIEPHYLFLGFQWLPIKTRVWLLRHSDLGHIKRITDQGKAKEQIESIRLLKKSELINLFPDSEIYEEHFFGLTKSFIVYNKDWE